MAIHGKQLKDASIDLTKLEGISAAPTAGQLLVAASNGSMQALNVGGDLTASVSGSSLNFTIGNSAVEFSMIAPILDQDDMSSDSDVHLATQQSIKAYVDSAVSTSSGNQSLSFAGDSGSDTLVLSTDTFTIAGGSNLTTAVTDNKVSIALDSHINLTSATLSALSVGADAIIGGTLTVSGNLAVSGTTTTVNSTTVTIEDKNIQLASNATSDIEADGGGITVAANKTFTWENSSNTAWTSSDNLDLVSGKAYYINNTQVLSTDGAAKVQSGVAGDGLAHTTGILSLDLNELTAAVVDVASDSIAIVDSSDSNASRKESIADLATAMAGTSTSTGLKATNGVFQVTLTSFMESGSIASNQVDGSTVDVVTLTNTPVAAIDLRINGIAYPEGTSTAGYWYNDNGTIKWNDDGLHEAGLLLDTDDKYQVIYDYNAS